MLIDILKALINSGLFNAENFQQLIQLIEKLIELAEAILKHIEVAE